MTRCLEDKTLFLLSEGEASEEQRSHLQGCRVCTERYQELGRDLRFHCADASARGAAPIPRGQSAALLQIFTDSGRGSVGHRYHVGGESALAASLDIATDTKRRYL